MMKPNLLGYLNERRSQGKKSLAVLIDPDKQAQLDSLLKVCTKSMPDLFLVGSSFRGDEQTGACIRKLKSALNIPVALFPGNMNQVSPEADGILLLSVISSRNPDLLIGRHVEAAMRVRESQLEVIPTGYVLVESGRLTSVQYMSQSLPVPRSKPELAAATALAGEQLGMKIIYLEAGSGAEQTVPSEMISAVRKTIGGVLFTGGGITNAEQLRTCYRSGADVAVVGNALESSPELLTTFIAERDTLTA